VVAVVTLLRMSGLKPRRRPELKETASAAVGKITGVIPFAIAGVLR